MNRLPEIPFSTQQGFCQLLGKPEIGGTRWYAAESRYVFISGWLPTAKSHCPRRAFTCFRLFIPHNSLMSEVLLSPFYRLEN